MKKIVTTETVKSKDLAEYINKAIKHKEQILSVTPTETYYYSDTEVFVEYEVATQRIE